MTMKEAVLLRINLIKLKLFFHKENGKSLILMTTTLIKQWNSKISYSYLKMMEQLKDQQTFIRKMETRIIKAHLKMENNWSLISTGSILLINSTITGTFFLSVCRK